MGNIVTTFKRFFSNKNTVTIIGVLLGLIVLYIGYNYRVKTAVSTINVPVAKKAIYGRTPITSELITQTEVLSSMVTDKKSTIIRSNANLISANDPFCVAVNTSIPAGGFFHKEQVVKCASVNGNYLKNMPDNHSPVSIPVDIHTTYGNSMMPGDYIDIYARMTSSDGKLIFAKLVSKLEIMAVVDNKGQNVFGGATVGTPAELQFACPNVQDGINLFMLLTKAILLGESRVELIPMPGNASYTSTPGETRVDSNYMMNLILSYTEEVPDESVPEQ